MRVSYLWLAELARTDPGPGRAAEILTSLGLETTIAEDRRGWYEGVVCGHVTSARPHPNADRLTLCEVDVGGAAKKIVCGAPNVAAGQDVVVALPGATLPNGMKIESRKVRGEFSEGMICAMDELALGDDHAGILVLDDAPRPGELFAERYPARDTMLEVDLTPNRGDCLSIMGVARELAAAYGTTLGRPAADMREDGARAADHIGVRIEAPELCPRYAGRVIVALAVRPSPLWMRMRLHTLGVRAINNLVDVTNYILMELGHPLHAFDLARLEGKQIIVRRAAQGERFTTLDGQERALRPADLVIADATRPVALAGIMGGQNSEVTLATTQVMLESAFFDPKAIRRTSRALGVASESSYRFERGRDIEGLEYALDRAAALMAQLGGGRVLSGKVDEWPVKTPRPRVAMRYARADQIIGAATPPEQVKQILARLEMKIVEETGEAVTVEAPPFPEDHPMRRLVKLDNPLSSEWTHLRSSMLPGMLASLPKADDALFYEIEKVFEERAAGEAPLERWTAAAALTETISPGAWSGKAAKRDVFHAKGAVESLMRALGYGEPSFAPSAHPWYYPNRQLDVIAQGASVGHVGQIHPQTLAARELRQEIFVFELDLSALARLEPVAAAHRPLPRFPSVKRDLAVVVDAAVTAATLEESIRGHGGDLVRQVTLFDVYSGGKIGAGKKS
ncbi:MAG: phenylalanine--tRNA ligase subunit beta, partial [Nitrospinae bacterium]|nr:phenylalanine--tRNA ligase subunit beta [Nitrospinota bacterium]